MQRPRPLPETSSPVLINGERSATEKASGRMAMRKACIGIVSVAPVPVPEVQALAHCSKVT
jgi:hypothetical protein